MNSTMFRLGGRGAMVLAVPLLVQLGLCGWHARAHSRPVQLALTTEVERRSPRLEEGPVGALTPAERVGDLATPPAPVSQPSKAVRAHAPVARTAPPAPPAGPRNVAQAGSIAIPRAVQTGLGTHVPSVPDAPRDVRLKKR
jgi:hypothetical protein